MYVHGTQCIDTIQRDGAKDLPEGREVALLVNNLGSTPAMEMYIMARAALKFAQDKHRVQYAVVLHVCILLHCCKAWIQTRPLMCMATLLVSNLCYWLHCNCCTFSECALYRAYGYTFICILAGYSCDARPLCTRLGLSHWCLYQTAAQTTAVMLTVGPHPCGVYSDNKGCVCS